jgi:hypothetical protein
MGWIDDLIDDALMPVYDWARNIVSSVGRSIAGAFNAIGDFFKEMIMAPINGIDKMIADFEEIACFIKKLPPRIANIQSGVGNILTGVINQFEALGVAIELGYTDTKNLLVYTGEFISTYVQCLVKMTKNFYKCAIFYILEVIGKIIALPVRICFWAIYKFVGVDLYPLGEWLWALVDAIDGVIFSITGLHIAHYPFSIRDECYTCIRLKREAVREKADDLDYTFTKTIPDLMTYNKGACQIRRGKAQLDEVGRMPTARPPSEVQ